MTRRCIIHIGHPKTATTYLQHCLHLNEAVFRAHNYAVPGDFARFGFQDLVQLSRAGMHDAAKGVPITLRSFDRRFLADGDIFADFLATIAAPLTTADCILPPTPSNPGLTLEHYELLRAAALLRRPDAAQRLSEMNTQLTPDQRHRARSYYDRPALRDFLAQHYIPANTELLRRFMPTATPAEYNYWQTLPPAAPPTGLDTTLLENLRAVAFG